MDVRIEWKADELFYECSLNEANLKKARDELYEEPSERLTKCLYLLRWIKSQPHLRFPDTKDAKFLVMFLRGAKWRLDRAQKMISSYLTMKAQLPQWFLNIDSRDERILAVASSGYLTPLPRLDDNGSQIILYRICQLDPHWRDYSSCDVIRFTMLVGAYTTQHEETQVNGSVFIFDFTDASAKQMSSLMTMKDMEKFHKLWQGAMPGRVKALHFYNAGVFTRMALKLVRSFLKKKYQHRIHIHTSLDSLLCHVPRPSLPFEMQPEGEVFEDDAGSLDDIIENFKTEMMDETFQKNLLLHTSEEYGLKKQTT